MPQESDTFLEAEERARELVETLEQLTNEAQSYQAASSDLHAARDAVTSLATSIQPIAEATHELLRTARSVGGPAILEAAEGLSQQAKTQYDEAKSKISQLEVHHKTTLSALTKMADAAKEQMELLSSQIEAAKQTATAAVVAAAIAAVLAGLGLLLP